MSLANLDDLATSLEEKTNKLLDDARTAEHRLAVAQNTAKSLETRNQETIALIDIEVERHKNEVMAKAQEEIDILDSEVKAAVKVKQAILDDIEKLNLKKSTVEEMADSLLEAHTNLQTKIVEMTEELEDLNDKTLRSINSLKENDDKINDQKNTIRELESIKQQTEADLEILKTEQDNVESKIMDLDADFQSQKQYADDQLYQASLELKRTDLALKEAQNKDKAFRQEWAEKNLALEKRTEAVRRIEARVSDAESRIEELNRFDVL